MPTSLHISLVVPMQVAWEERNVSLLPHGLGTRGFTKYVHPTRGDVMMMKGSKVD